MNTPTAPATVNLTGRLNNSPALELLALAYHTEGTAYALRIAREIAVVMRELHPDAHTFTFATRYTGDDSNVPELEVVKLHDCDGNVLWFSPTVAHHCDAKLAAHLIPQRVSLSDSAIHAIVWGLNEIILTRSAAALVGAYGPIIVRSDDYELASDGADPAWVFQIAEALDGRPVPRLVRCPEMGGVYWQHLTTYALMFTPTRADGLPDTTRTAEVDFDSIDDTEAGYAHAAEAKILGGVTCPQPTDADQLRQFVDRVAAMFKTSEGDDGHVNRLALLDMFIGQARELLAPKVWVIPQHDTADGRWCRLSGSRISNPDRWETADPRSCWCGAPGTQAVPVAAREH